MQIDFVADQAFATDAAQVLLVHEADLDALLPWQSAIAKAAGFTAQAGKVLEIWASHEDAPRRILLIGLAGEGTPQERMEQAGSALAVYAASHGIASAMVDLSGYAAPDMAAFLLALRLRHWRESGFKSKAAKDDKPRLGQVYVLGADAMAQQAHAEACAVAEGVEWTRKLVTQPGNVLYPESFVAQCAARFEGTGLKLTVLDEAEMRALGMHALLGVAQGSARPARLLVIEWQGAQGQPIALIGKGVTFDTGGISIKPAQGMEDMKWDMGGAAAVAGAMLTLALRGAKAHVVGLCGLVENMPDGKAQRPGDVVTSMSGQTIEVINTDAEGRLVLCDVLTYAQKTYQPAMMVDLATLTGAIIGALGHEYAGLFSPDDALAQALTTAGEKSGERLWRMPMGKAYDAMIDSDIADIKNLGGKFAGSTTAAQFLARFIDEGRPWAHLDIAGMAWAEKDSTMFAKGATGYGVRLLDQLVRDLVEGAKL